MMNADKQMLYSGVPQDDWENKSKYPKILSNGPKIIKPKVKSARNAGMVSFLILTLVAIVLSLGIVIGLHYLKYSDETGLVFINSDNKTETEVNKPLDDKISLTSQSPAEAGVNKNEKDKDKDKEIKDKEDKGKEDKDKDDKGKDDKGKKDKEKEDKDDKDKHTNSPKDEEKEDQKKDMDTDNLKKQNPENKMTPKTEYKIDEVTSTTNAPQKPQTTTEDDWLDIIKTNDQLYTYDDILDKITSDPSLNKDEKNKKEETEDKKDKINDESKEIDIKDNKSNSTKTENSDENDSESLSKIISNFASKYFNSSSLRKEEILQWMEKLTARPSLEVIIIASGIIFVGLSLLIIAITCLLTRTRRVKIRREKINKAMSDLEGGEKVILLTDEPSEDEYVKT